MQPNQAGNNQMCISFQVDSVQSCYISHTVWAGKLQFKLIRILFTPSTAHFHSAVLPAHCLLYWSLQKGTQTSTHSADIIITGRKSVACSASVSLSSYRSERYPYLAPENFTC